MGGMTEIENDEDHHESAGYGRSEYEEQQVGEDFRGIVRAGDLAARRNTVFAPYQRRLHVDQCAVLEMLENLRAEK